MRGGATCFDGEHAAPEVFDDRPVAYCFKCGELIRWFDDDEKTGWFEDEDLVALVLEPDEVAILQALVTNDALLRSDATDISPDDVDSFRRMLNV